MELSKLLRQTRIEMGMTQIEISQALHLSFSTVNRWENGRTRPNRLASVTVLALAKEKGASPSSLDLLESALFDGDPSWKGVFPCGKQ